MKSLFSWLLAFFMVIFWGFRIIVAIFAQMGKDFGGFIAFDNTTEVILLFVSILCFVLYLRRRILGPVIYLAGYGYYFGTYIFNVAIPALADAETLDFIVFENLFVALIGLVFGLLSLFDVLIDRAKMKHFSDQKTDWFFDNKDYDRKMDDRADKNQYRTM